MGNFIGAISDGAFWTGLDWPAWVQAIGSIAAIVVAIAIARKTNKNQLKLTKDEETKFLRYAILEAHKGTHRCESIHIALKEHINGNGNRSFYREIGNLKYNKKAIHKINSLPVTVWPDYTYTQCFDNWTRAFEEFEIEVTPLINRVVLKEVKDMSPEDVKAMDALMAQSRASLDRVVRNFDSFDGNHITLERARQDRMFSQRKQTIHPSARWYQ